MKLESAAILIAALLSVAVSGCSSFRIALDTIYAQERYQLQSQTEEILEDNSIENLPVLPKIVNENNYRPLFVFEKQYPSYGFDYEIIYLGYDTPTLISDVINRKKSLSTALEEPDTESENNLRIFIFSPTILGVFPISGNIFMGFGLLVPYDDAIYMGLPSYKAISYNNSKYEMSRFFGWQQFFGVNMFGEYSMYGKVTQIEMTANTEDNTNQIAIEYYSLSAGYRFYF
jgi:hypothetical protein